MRRLFTLCFVAIGCILPASAVAAPVGFTPSTIAVEGQPLDVAVGDLDGHNGPDLVASVGEGIAVMLNNGNGTFAAPHVYPAGCPVYEVELGDLVNTSMQNVVDGNLDVVYNCVYNGGDTQYLGRMAGNGAGGFGAPDLHPELNFGFLAGVNLQAFALADLRGPGLPPVPVFGYTSQVGLSYPTYLCLSYDWTTATCLNNGEYPSIGKPIIAGEVAEARIFSLGGAKGIADFGPTSGVWSASTRELAPAPPSKSGEHFNSIAIGDLQGDGPDILSSAGTCGCEFEDDPAAGVVDVLYGTTAAGVPDQVGAKFPSAPGVISIGTGDFNVDGHEDVIGHSWSYEAASHTETDAVFVQPGNGAGALGAPEIIPLSHSGFNFSDRAPIRVADFDGNGGPDAAVIAGGKIEVLLNTQSKAAVKLNPLAGINGLLKSVRADKNGNVLLGTATNPPTASVSLTITLPAGKGGKEKALTPAKGKKKKKNGIVIGRAKIKIPSGKKRPLKVHLGAKGRAKLKKGSLKTKLTIVAVATDGSTKTETRGLTIKPPKPKKHHH